MINIAHVKRPEAQQLNFRALTSDDAEAYRDLRLKALAVDGHWFTADLAKESARLPQEWRRICSERPDNVIFAAYFGEQLVGSTGIEPYAEGVVKWHSTFIESHLRGLGIAETLFDMCSHWCHINAYAEAVFTIRADNMRARTIQEKNGAEFVKEEDKVFADGSVAVVRWYRKRLTA